MLVSGISSTPKTKQNINFSRVVKLYTNQQFDALATMKQENNTAFFLRIISRNPEHHFISNDKLTFKVSDEGRFGDEDIAAFQEFLKSDSLRWNPRKINESDMKIIESANASQGKTDFIFLEVTEFGVEDPTIPPNRNKEPEFKGKQLYYIEGEKLTELMEMLEQTGIEQIEVKANESTGKAVVWGPSYYSPASQASC